MLNSNLSFTSEDDKSTEAWYNSQRLSRLSRFKLMKPRAGKEMKLFLTACCVSNANANAVTRFAQHRLFEPHLLNLVNSFVGTASRFLNLDFSPNEVAFDEEREELFVLDFKNVIHVYDFHGNHLRSFDTIKDDAIVTFHVNSQLGCILITDPCNKLFRIMSSIDGSLIRTICNYIISATGVAIYVQSHAFVDNGCNHRIFVCSCHNHCVYVFSENGTFLFKFGSYGTGAGQLYGPFKISIDSKRDEVYVAENGNRRVSVFSTGGQFLRHFDIKKYVHRIHTTQIAFHDITSTILVVDTERYELQVLDRDGRFLRSLDCEGSEFQTLCVHQFSGHIAVADSETHRIQIITM